MVGVFSRKVPSDAGSVPTSVVENEPTEPAKESEMKVEEFAFDENPYESMPPFMDITTEGKREFEELKKSSVTATPTTYRHEKDDRKQFNFSFNPRHVRTSAMEMRKKTMEKGELFEEQFGKDAVKNIRVQCSDGSLIQPVGSASSCLCPELMSNLQQQWGHDMDLLPLQRYTYPVLHDASKDLFCIAPTGSGKTLAFLIPIFQKLLRGGRRADRHCRPAALVVANTQQLVVQIYEDALKLALGTSLSIVLVCGQTNYREAERLLHQGVDVVIASAGRLKHYMSRQVIILDHLQYFIFDEADKMLAYSAFLDEMIDLVKTIPEKQREMMCSGFFSATIGGLRFDQDKFARDSYVTVEVPPNRGIEHVVYPIASHEHIKKRLLLLQLLIDDLERQGLSLDMTRVPGMYKQLTVVFANEKKTVNFLADYLTSHELNVCVLNSSKTLKCRIDQLSEAASGNVQVIVATDMFARGHDVSNITHVINYNMPNTIEDYIHRSGRTGRLGNRGRCSAFFCLQSNSHTLAGPLAYHIYNSRSKVPEFLEQALLDYTDLMGIEGLEPLDSDQDDEYYEDPDDEEERIVCPPTDDDDDDDDESIDGVIMADQSSFC